MPLASGAKGKQPVPTPRSEHDPTSSKTPARVVSKAAPKAGLKRTPVLTPNAACAPLRRAPARSEFVDDEASEGEASASESSEVMLTPNDGSDEDDSEDSEDSVEAIPPQARSRKRGAGEQSSDESSSEEDNSNEGSSEKESSDEESADKNASEAHAHNDVPARVASGQEDSSEEDSSEEGSSEDGSGEDEDEDEGSSVGSEVRGGGNKNDGSDDDESSNAGAITPPPPLSKGKGRAADPVVASFAEDDDDNDDDDGDDDDDDDGNFFFNDVRMEPSSPIPSHLRSPPYSITAPMSPPYEFDNRELHSPTRLPREADFTHVSDMHSTFGNLNVDVDERDAEQSHDEPMEVDDPPEPEGWATVSVRSYSPSPVRPGAETPGAGPSHAAWDLELQRTRHFVGQRRSSQGEHVQDSKGFTLHSRHDQALLRTKGAGAHLVPPRLQYWTVSSRNRPNPPRRLGRSFVVADCLCSAPGMNKERQVSLRPYSVLLLLYLPLTLFPGSDHRAR